jgi:hypothetical protein
VRLSAELFVGFLSITFLEFYLDFSKNDF